MIGSIFWNIWMMIGGFSLYFLLAVRNGGAPWPVIIGSFTAAIVFFLLMFIIRFMLFQAFPSTDLDEKEEIDDSTKDAELAESEEFVSNLGLSHADTPVIEDDQSEKTAAIVRHMLNQ